MSFIYLDICIVIDPVTGDIWAVLIQDNSDPLVALNDPLPQHFLGELWLKTIELPHQPPNFHPSQFLYYRYRPQTSVGM